MKIFLKNARLAFPQLFEAKQVNGEGKPAFSASFIIPKNHPQIAEINKIIDEVAKEAWKGKAAEIVAELRKKDKVCLHDGNDKKQYDGYAGNLYISARSQTRPLIIDGKKQPLVQADGRPYGGCYVNASLDIWAQMNQYGSRVNASVAGVQFLRDGDAFGGGQPASVDDFEEVEEDVA